MGGMVKYACDQKEESPYRDTSRRLKRIQTARFCGLCASAAVLAMAFVSHSKGLVLVWMAYCLAVHLAADVCKGKIYDGLFREEQREFQAFAGKLSGGPGGFCPDRLGFAYRSDGDDCVPVLCEFQEDRVLVLGPVLTKHFIAYISGRMIYAFTFRSTAYEPVGTLPGGFSGRRGRTGLGGACGPAPEIFVRGGKRARTLSHCGEFYLRRGVWEYGEGQEKPALRHRPAVKPDEEGSRVWHPHRGGALGGSPEDLGTGKTGRKRGFK